VVSRGLCRRGDLPAFRAINTGKEDPGADDDKKVKDEGVKGQANSSVKFCMIDYCGLLPGWASSDLLAGVLSAMETPSPGQWSSQKFDKEYTQPMDPGLNSIRGHVLYYVFQLTKTTDEGDEVTVKYIHCQGVREIFLSTLLRYIFCFRFSMK